MKFWLFLAATLALDLIGVSLAKKYVTTDNTWWLVGAIALFGVMVVTLTQMLRLESLAITNAIWGGTTALGTVLIGWFVFHEKISTLQVLGIILVVGGVILLEWPGKKI